MKPGAWRRCLACCEGKNPVTWAAQFHLEKSQDCSKSARRADLTVLNSADGTSTIYRCKTCASKKEQFTCTVCNRKKERQEFRGRLNQKKTILRCNECRTCDTCGDLFEDAKHFVCNTRQCVKCVTHTCTVCGQSKRADNFQAMHIKNLNRNIGQQTKLQCNECSTAKRYACAAPPCKQFKPLRPESSFNPQQIKRMKTKGEQLTLVCRSCTDLGYSGRTNGTTTYQCARCGEHLGHQRFTSNALKNKQRRPHSNL